VPTCPFPAGRNKFYPFGQSGLRGARVGLGSCRGNGGENGAGKTTLINVLYGLMQPDEGEIRIDGTPVSFHSPKEAIAAGIGLVHQHFMLAPVFTVAENATLGIEQAGRAGLLDRCRTRRDVRDLSHRYGLDVNPDAAVEDLPVGIQQRVEIVNRRKDGLVGSFSVGRRRPYVKS